MEVQRENLEYAIQALATFLNLTSASELLNQEDSDRLKTSVVTLLEQVKSAQVNIDEGIALFNRLVKEINQLQAQAPYPYFMTDSYENLLKSEIVAFEHYLNQGVKAKLLTIQQEAPLFNDALQLWEQIGEKCTSKEGEESFCALIQKANTFLTEQYPLPNHDNSSSKS